MEQKEEIKLCECGCGTPTKIITHTCIKEGRIKGQYNKGFKVLRLWEHEIKLMGVNEFSERLKIGG